MLARFRSTIALVALLGVLGCGTEGTGAGDVLIVAEVEISPPVLALVDGNTAQLEAIPRSSSGIVIPNRQATWSSDDPGVASVSSAGVVTAVATGSTHINATIDNVRAQATVEVSPRAVAAVSVDPAQLTLLVGETGNLTVTARDAAGEPLPGRPVTFSSDNPLIATVSAAGLVAGVSTGLTVITATIEGKSATANVMVSSLPATQLDFQNEPATGAAGSPIPAVRVEVQNSQGGMVTEGGLPVTVSLADNPTDAVLSGTLTVNAVNGVATFSDIRVNEAGVGYTLRATSGSLSPALSAPFAVVAGTASRLTIATQPPATAQSGVPLAVQPRIQIRDAGGNEVAQAGVQVTVALEGAGATLGGTLSVSTNAEGLATFTGLVITGSAGVYTLLFAAPGLIAIASDGIAIAAGAPGQSRCRAAARGHDAKRRPARAAAGAAARGCGRQHRDPGRDRGHRDDSNRWRRARRIGDGANGRRWTRHVHESVDQRVRGAAGAPVQRRIGGTGSLRTRRRAPGPAGGTRDRHPATVGHGEWRGAHARRRTPGRGRGRERGDPNPQIVITAAIASGTGGTLERNHIGNDCGRRRHLLRVDPYRGGRAVHAQLLQLGSHPGCVADHHDRPRATDRARDRHPARLPRRRAGSPSPSSR